MLARKRDPELCDAFQASFESDITEGIPLEELFREGNFDEKFFLSNALDIVQSRQSEEKNKKA